MEKNWRRSEHAHASYPGLSLLSPARVQPLYGAERKETGLEGAKKQKRTIIEMGGGVVLISYLFCPRLFRYETAAEIEPTIKTST